MRKVQISISKAYYQGKGNTWRSNIRIYDGNELLNQIEKYAGLAGSFPYKLKFDKKIYINLKPNLRGSKRQASIQNNKGRKFAQFYIYGTRLEEAQLFKQPYQFFDISNAKLENNILTIDLLNVHDEQNADNQQISEEKAKSLVGELAVEVADKLSSNRDLSMDLARKLEVNMTTNSDFINKLADAITFKLNQPLSTRLNRLDESTRAYNEKTQKVLKETSENLIKFWSK